MFNYHSLQQILKIFATILNANKSMPKFFDTLRSIVVVIGEIYPVMICINSLIFANFSTKLCLKTLKEENDIPKLFK